MPTEMLLALTGTVRENPKLKEVLIDRNQAENAPKFKHFPERE